ncbi:terpene synthase family protein [Microbispora sp. NBC_01189]|uniref:terpene synthase family protein n=1 Tax=Microbispora sp. NBC_01189 TaxID=2903583 RepID=UPI002E145C32|nr:terpene synthase family protein [Microbispora sp. NBC_01189]
MHKTKPTGDALRAARECGAAAAVSAGLQRDLRECQAAYPGLFPARPFDSTLFSAVAQANAFGAMWASTDRLRVASRTALWIFALDWLLDYVATSREEVDPLVRGCLDVADGALPPPDFPLGRFLAEIREELAAAPAFAGLEPVWREELRRTLSAMAREWDWKTAAREGTPLPTLDEYLANADNFGSSFVNVSHWIRGGDPAALGHFDELRAASGQVQRVLRLLNDLATYERDLAWGDLNALMLCSGREEIAGRVGVLVDGCGELLEPLRDVCPDEVVYLERQIGYSMGFYGITDYWGGL